MNFKIISYLFLFGSKQESLLLEANPDEEVVLPAPSEVVGSGMKVADITKIEKKLKRKIKETEQNKKRKRLIAAKETLAKQSSSSAKIPEIQDEPSSQLTIEADSQKPKEKAGILSKIKSTLKKKQTESETGLPIPPPPVFNDGIAGSTTGIKETVKKNKGDASLETTTNLDVINKKADSLKQQPDKLKQTCSKKGYKGIKSKPLIGDEEASKKTPKTAKEISSPDYPVASDAVIKEGTFPSNLTDALPDVKKNQPIKNEKAGIFARFRLAFARTKEQPKEEVDKSIEELKKLAEKDNLVVKQENKLADKKQGIFGKIRSKINAGQEKIPAEKNPKDEIFALKEDNEKPDNAFKDNASELNSESDDKPKKISQLEKEKSAIESRLKKQIAALISQKSQLEQKVNRPWPKNAKGRKKFFDKLNKELQLIKGSESRLKAALLNLKKAKQDSEKLLKSKIASITEEKNKLDNELSSIKTKIDDMEKGGVFSKLKPNNDSEEKQSKLKDEITALTKSKEDSEQLLTHKINSIEKERESVEDSLREEIASLKKEKEELTKSLEKKSVDSEYNEVNPKTENISVKTEKESKEKQKIIRVKGYKQESMQAQKNPAIPSYEEFRSKLEDEGISIKDADEDAEVVLSELEKPEKKIEALIDKEESHYIKKPGLFEKLRRSRKEKNEKKDVESEIKAAVIGAKKQPFPSLSIPEIKEEILPQVSPFGDTMVKSVQSSLEEIRKKIQDARLAIMDLKLYDAKRQYIEIIKAYNSLSQAEQSEAYQEISELYEDRKNAEKMAK